MWIFTSKGFISAVESDKDPSLIVVRARDENHLKALFPSDQIVVIAGRDYPCRVIVSRGEFMWAVTREMEGINYTNFKDSIIDDPYHDACLDVWSAMFKYQVSKKHKYIPRRFKNYERAIPCRV